jgi:hypothetical protein
MQWGHINRWKSVLVGAGLAAAIWGLGVVEAMRQVKVCLHARKNYPRQTQLEFYLSPEASEKLRWLPSRLSVERWASRRAY